MLQHFGPTDFFMYNAPHYKLAPFLEILRKFYVDTYQINASIPHTHHSELIGPHVGHGFAD